jgi:hypothetical protein
MIPQLKSIFNQNQLTSLINLLTQNVNALIAGKENVSNKQNSLAPDVTNTKYPTVTAVNTGLATKLNLTGGTMSGPIEMGTSKITGLGNPTANQDAATKFYVDNNVGAIPSLNQVLTTGNTSQLNASIRTLGLFDPTYVNYGNVSLNNNVFIITNSFTTQVIKMQDTVFSLGFHSNTKTVNLDSQLLSANRTFTFPDIDGTFAMESYVDTAAAIAQGNAITSANAYTDTQVADLQTDYDLANAASGTATVTINATSGVATFTQTLSGKSNAYYQVNNTSIALGDKIEFSLYYTGAGFPIIMHYNTLSNRIRFHVGNPAIDGGSGTATNADLVITFRKI